MVVGYWSAFAQTNQPLPNARAATDVILLPLLL
jgi:hypothetical protein